MCVFVFVIVCVCLSVCLSVCEQDNLKSCPVMQNLYRTNSRVLDLHRRRERSCRLGM